VTPAAADASSAGSPGIPGIAAILLAAGASRRMGANKMLLDVDGETMVRRAARRALDAGCAPLVVVTGHQAADVRAALAGLDVQFAESPDPLGPTSGSLHAGLRALGATADAAMVLLADMVEVTTPMLRALIADLTDADAPLAVSRYGGVLAPPLLFRRALWPELLAWTGEGCGKAVAQAHLTEAVVHDWPAEALHDVDTPADYLTAQRRGSA
jgi:molybdenum cofactor cytidylyltransferase